MMRTGRFLLISLAGALLIFLGAKNYNKTPQDKASSKQEGELPKNKESGKNASETPPKEISVEDLRESAFQETNPDFSYPARKERYFYHGPGSGERICLSFDDGPHPRYTPQILSILKEKKAKATFFLTGENARNYPHIVKAIVEAGCEVGNHSYAHPNLRKLSPERIREELEKTQAEIQKACGVTPLTVRFPYGVSSEEVARAAYQMRLDPFFWSIDTHDYKNDSTTQDIVRTVLKDVKGGSIILMHDKSQKVVDAVKELIDPLREKGLEFATCSELAGDARLLKRQMENKDRRENALNLKDGGDL